MKHNLTKQRIMKSLKVLKIWSSVLLLALITNCETNQKQLVKENPSPNILLIVADDLGYSDIGPFGGEIATPELDKLANQGVRLSNFYVLPTCSPTRSALLSGNDNHVAGMGVMGELIYPQLAGREGYEGHLNDRIVTLQEVLKENGYHTYMSGKWHLGDEDEHIPYARGFEETFILAQGGGSHWADGKGVSPLSHMTYRRNGKVVESLPDDFYSSRNYTDSLISFINHNQEDNKPFFGYLSFTAPHDPLHAPAEYISKYKGTYDEGWGNLAEIRLERLQELGIVGEDISAFPGIPAVHDWETLTDEQQALYARDMEVYAAMVDYMDMSIGRVFEYLKEIGEYDNTLIIFFSDNGANGIPPIAYPGNADGQYLGSFDNSLENRGLPNSFIDMGPGWAQAASTPSRLFKSFTTQGGIHSPCIIKTPGEMETAGQIKNAFMHVSDIMPTIFEMASVAYPETFHGREVIPPTGKSGLAYVQGKAETVHGPDHGQGWELFEMKAYIKGEWKILRLPPPFDNGNWALYNLTKDPGETTDLSDQFPEIKQELLNGWEDYVRTNHIFDHNGHFDSLYLRASQAINH